LTLSGVETCTDLTAINTPGLVTGGPSIISFDNLLTAGTKNYTADAGVLIWVNGAAFDTSIPADAATSITVANASTLKCTMDNTYCPAADAILQVLGRNRTTFEFVANLAPTSQMR